MVSGDGSSVYLYPIPIFQSYLWMGCFFQLSVRNSCLFFICIGLDFREGVLISPNATIDLPKIISFHELILLPTAHQLHGEFVIFSPILPPNDQST